MIQIQLHGLLAAVFVGITLLTSAVATAEVTAKPSAKEIAYVGRWNKGADEAVSKWAGSYVKLGFTGDRITVRLGEKPSSFYAIMDGGAPQAIANKTGAVELTAGAGGSHQLKLVAEVGKELHLRGVSVPDGQSIKPAELRKGLVLFIGDSITFGASATNPTLESWAPLAAEAAGLEHARVAQGGIGLADGYKAPLGTVGMEKQFFQQNAFGQANGDKPYAFDEASKPSLIVINLGTNDGNKNENNPVPMNVFQERYAGFIQKLRARYPEARILALQLFNTYAGDKNKAIEGAVQAVNAAGDKNVYYVSAQGWVNPDPKGGDIKPDWSHPTDQGHQKIATKMTGVLKQHAGATAATKTPGH